MARAFDSTPKKLAIPLFGIFFIGLIVFTAGFGLLLSKEEDDLLKVESNNKSPVYFPYYTTLVGGIFVILLGLLHAALPSGIPSSIIGALSTILNTIYFLSVGYVINMSYVEIWSIWWNQKQNSYYDHDQSPVYHNPQLVRAVKLMLAGSIILAVSWGLLQFLSHFYEQSPQSVQTRSLWRVIVECWKNKTTLVRDVSESVRLSSIPAVLLSAVGWCVFIGGLHSSTSYWNYVTHGSWSATTITPLMYVAAILHAGNTGKASFLMASILNTFFVVGMGFSVTVEGSYLYQTLHQHTGEYSQEDRDSIHSGLLMLCGGVVCLMFWTVVLVLWPLYQPKGTSYGRVPSSGIINDNYDNGLLLPASASSSAAVTDQQHVTDNREYTQQLPHVEVYQTSEREAGNV